MAEEFDSKHKTLSGLDVPMPTRPLPDEPTHLTTIMSLSTGDPICSVPVSLVGKLFHWST